MWKDENLLLDYATFWGPQNRALIDYVAKPGTDDSIRNFELCIDSSTPRIMNTRQPDRAEDIIFNFKVSLSIFRIIYSVRLYHAPQFEKTILGHFKQIQRRT